MIGKRYALMMLACVLSLVVVSSAQENTDAGIRAWLGKERVTQGSEARLFIEVIGPGAADCELSPFPRSDRYRVEGIKGPDFFMRPARESKGEGGRLVAAYEMVIIPLAAGVIDLPPVRIVVAGGRQFMGPALSMQVDGLAPLDGEASLSVRIEKNPVYLEQRLVFHVMLQLSRDRFMAVERGGGEELSLSWLETEPSFVSLRMGAIEEGRSRRSIPVLDGKSAIDFAFERRDEGGKEICVLITSASYLPTKPGTFDFAPCAYTVRLPGSETLRCESAGFEVEVRPLPDRDRPDSMTNGVGRFHVTMEASPLTLRVGDPLLLRFSVQGQGNLERLAMPGFPALKRGFRMLGIDDGGEGSTRWRVFHLAPLNSRISEIPGLRFSWFDPEKREYETFSWGPQKIVLLPGKDRENDAVTREGTAKEPDSNPRELDARSGVKFLRDLSLLALALSGFVLACCAIIALRRRARVRAEERAGRPQALVDFERGLEAEDPVSSETLARLLGDYLQARFGLSQPEALAGALPDLLEKQGISIEPAGAVERFIRGLDASRFAAREGTADASDEKKAEALALIRALEEEAGS